MEVKTPAKIGSGPALWALGRVYLSATKLSFSLSSQRPLSLAKDIVFLVLGVLCAAFGLESFLLPNDFIDGGVTGVSLLLAQVTGVKVSLLLFLVNLPFIFLGRYVVGSQFALKTTAAIVVLSIVIYFFHWPEVTNDKLLVSIFGGFFLGTGIGLSMRGGGVLDGTEILAIYLSRRLGLKVSDWIVLINLLIFSVAAYVLSIEQALYSLITYFVASKALDFIIDGIEEYMQVTIISPQHEAIRQALIAQSRTGVTILRGKGGYENGADKDILYVVITRLEMRKVFNIIEGVDERAFITVTSISDVRGGMVKKRATH